MQIQDWQKPARFLNNIVAHEVHIWRAPLFASDEMLETAKSTLSAIELQRGQRLITPLLRRRFWMAHAWKRNILSHYLPIPAEQLLFKEGNHGKPYLQDEKTSLKSAIHFNMSHSAEWALFALTKNDEVGIDVEKIEYRLSPLELAQRFFAPQEYQFLQKLPENKLFQSFYQIWALKEAVVKALSKGLNYSLSSFAVGLEKDFTPCLHYFEEKNLHSMTVFAFSAITGYTSAVALTNQINKCCLWDVCL